MKKIIRAVGLFSMILGAAFLFNLFSGITGFAVFGLVSSRVSGIIGLVLLVVGLLIVILLGHHRHRSKKSLQEKKKEEADY